jgi:hypothetical protein
MSDEFEITIPVVRGEGVGVPIGEIQRAINVICQQMQTDLNLIASGGFPLTDVDITGGTITGVAISNSTGVTQPTTDNSTLLATDAFVNQQIIRSTETVPLTLTGGTYNQATLGSGFSPVVLTSAGVIQSILTIAVAGTGYAVGDLVTLAGGNDDATLRVTTIGAGGSVTAAQILYGGTGYSNGAQIMATPIPPGDRNVVLTGVLTSNVTFIISNGTYDTASRRPSFANNTTGAFTVTVFLSNGADGTTGTGYVLPQGTANSTAVLLQTDGETGVWPVVSVGSILPGTTNVRAYGAVGNGTADDTAAIQAALNASSVVYFPPGTYFVSSTLMAQPNATLWAYDPDQTIIYRTGNYGDTLVCGSSTVSAGSFRAFNIWFKHSTFYTPGVNSLPNLTTSGAHIRLWGAQNCNIEGCYFLRLPYNIVCHGGSIIRIHRNTLWGVWDPSFSAAQEGIACVNMDATSAFTFPNPKDLFLTNNEFLGANSALRSVTLTDGNGNQQTVSMYQNIGPQYNVWVTGCETMTVTGNYIGDAATNNVYLNPTAPNGFVANARFSNNLFDGSQQAQFNTNLASSSANPILHLSVVDNDFNGELSTFRHVAILANAGLPSVYDLDFSGNRLNASYGGGGIIQGAVDFTISDNSITNYNCLEVTPSSNPIDAQWASALYVTGPDTQSFFGLMDGNNIGGGGNNIGATGNYCWLGFYLDSTQDKVKVGRTTYMGVGPTPLYGVSEDEYVFVSGTTYTASAFVKTILCGNTAPLTITLPSNAPQGASLTIKDINAAGTNNITLSGNVDGNGNYVMNVTKQALVLYSNGTGVWYATDNSSSGAASTFTASGAITPSQTAGIVGTTTNNNANAGSVGEVIPSSVAVGSAVGLTTGTPANVTSILLTAGDWDVWGQVAFNPNASTTIAMVAGWINTASATQPLPSNIAAALNFLSASFGTGQGQVLPTGATRLSLSATTTVYLGAQSTFGISTMGAYGYIMARRRR